MLAVQHKNIYATIVKLDHAFSRCVVQDCSNTSDKNAGRSLHKSPNDESLRRISVRFVQTKHANFYPSSREIRFMICLDHFSTDCFERLFHLDGLQRRLKPDSVPTIWRKAPTQLTTRDRRKV
jgi:hypothetical protein